MNYSQEDFFALMEAVENVGGEHLDDVCGPKTYKWIGTGIKPITYPGHSGAASFLIPYEATDKKGEGMGLHPHRACAVEDDLARWPRFGGDEYASDAHRIPFPDEGGDK